LCHLLYPCLLIRSHKDWPDSNISLAIRYPATLSCSLSQPSQIVLQLAMAVLLVSLKPPNLTEFLFGRDRNAITTARPVLFDIQQGQCFYCHKSLNETGEVDHFIPWARYPNDLGHNFVLAHSKCNNAKRDHLAAEQHKERWFEQNIIQHHST